MIKTGDVIGGLFCTVGATGALTAATGTPLGTIYVNGTAGTAVTVTGSNPYVWSGTMPTISAGQPVQLYVTATISSVSTGGIVWTGDGDTKRVSDALSVSSGTVDVATAVTNAVTVSAGTITAVTNPVSVNAGTVAVATSVTNPVTVSAGTVAVATSVTNPVTVSAGTVTEVTNPVSVSGGTVTAGTVSDKTGYSLAADQSAVTVGTVNTVVNAVTAQGTVTAGTVSDKTGYALSAAGNTAVADETYTRDWAAISAGTATRTGLQALRFLRNKWAVSGTVLTVYAEDDTTPAWTADLTTAASSDAITGSDPA